MFKSKKDVSLSEVFALFNLSSLGYIYQEYAQQIQGYQWWIYRQDSGVARRRKVGATNFFQKKWKAKEKGGHSGVKAQDRGYCG